MPETRAIAANSPALSRSPQDLQRVSRSSRTGACRGLASIASHIGLARCGLEPTPTSLNSRRAVVLAAARVLLSVPDLRLAQQIQRGRLAGSWSRRRIYVATPKMRSIRAFGRVAEGSPRRSANSRKGIAGLGQASERHRLRGQRHSEAQAASVIETSPRRSRRRGAAER